MKEKNQLVESWKQTITQANCQLTKHDLIHKRHRNQWRQELLKSRELVLCYIDTS